MKTTGIRIREFRKERGLTLEELGSRVGIQASAVAKYEKGAFKNPNRDVICRFAQVFNTTEAYLTGKLERDLRALDIEIRYWERGGVALTDPDGEYGTVTYSEERWLELQEQDDFKTVWSDLTKAKEKPTPASEDGLSEEKRKLIEAVKTMSDEEVRRLRVIVDQVILLRGE